MPLGAKLVLAFAVALFMLACGWGPVLEFRDDVRRGPA